MGTNSGDLLSGWMGDPPCFPQDPQGRCRLRRHALAEFARQGLHFQSHEYALESENQTFPPYRGRFGSLRETSSWLIP